MCNMPKFEIIITVEDINKYVYVIIENVLYGIELLYVKNFDKTF